jgi:SAM-dependent methyltransferase
MGDRRPDQRPERLPARPDVPLIAPAAATFEAVAEEYELGRPTWPAAAVEAAGLPRTAAVADLGAGTGKLTRVLLGCFEHVIAIEPLAGMRRLIPAEADVRAGTAEAIPLPDASLDGVFCGESFHWFDWPRALPEIARVLRPGGSLALLWNRGRHGFSKEVAALLPRSSAGERRYRAFAWRRAFKGAEFEPLRRRTFPNVEEVTREALIARIGSWSNFTTLPPEERAERLEQIGRLLTAASYRIRLETHAWYTRRA